MRTLIRHQLTIVLTGAAVFLIGLGAPKLWDEDEPEYARCTQEMMQRGDFIVPTFNHHLWTDKPVFLYWLMMGSFSLFGQTEFAARLPSALLAIGTALMTYHLGRRLFRPQVGLWAGLIMATNVMFVVIGRAATPDSPLIFCTTLSALAYVMAMGEGGWADEAHDGQAAGALNRFRAVLPRSWWWFVAIYAPLGPAVLIKGPVGVLLPVAALGMWVLIAGAAKRGPVNSEPSPPAPGGNRTSPPTVTIAGRSLQLLQSVGLRLKAIVVDFPAATWAMRPLTLAVVVLATALPWYAAVGILTHGRWTDDFLFRHNVHRFLHPMEQHAGSILYYPISLVIGFFPWDLPLLLGLIMVARRLRRGDAGGRACLFAICWTLTWFVAFSLSASKLPHYTAPAYPLLAIIAGLWVADWIAAPQMVFGRQWLQASWGALAAMGIALIVALPLVVSHWAPGQPSSNWLGLILVAGGGAGWWLQRRGDTAFAATSLVATAAALFVGMFAVAAVPISRQQTGLRLVDAVNRFADKATPIATYRIRLPDFVYYADRNEPIMGVRLADASNPRDSADLAREQTNGIASDSFFPNDTRLWLDNLDNALLITDLQGLEELRPILPPDAVVLARERRLLKRGELLLVGRRPVAAAAETAEGPRGVLK
jgi:4-amino-4-deoxy-L-arabinose transferase-like glycosyltransferase